MPIDPRPIKKLIHTSIPAALALVLGLTAGEGLAVTRSTEAPIENPDLALGCGLNVLMILDESGSIGDNDDNVRNAFKAFTGAIKNTSSSMAVAEFSKVARLPAIGAFAPGQYITVTDATKADLDDYVDNDYDPGGNTNWEDGLRMGNFSFAPRPDYRVPHLTVFITDGDPTQVIRNDRVTDDEYENKVPLSEDETTSSDKNPGADRAVANANALKAQGSHILAVAVGNGVSSSSSLDRIIKISGPDVFDGSGDFDITTDDVYQEDDFDKLEDALREAAFQLCAPSVTIQKIVDLTPDPNSLDDAIPGAGWNFSASVSAPGSGDFAWVLPVDQDPGTNPQDAVTDASGFATFQWTPADEIGPSGFSVSEVIESGFQNDPSQSSCTFRTPDQPNDQPLPGLVAGNGTFDVDIPIQSIVTCQMVNTAIPDPGISIEKLTDGSDADLAPGPRIPRGEDVRWTYIVTNTGNTRLGNVRVTDIIDNPVSTPPQQVPVNCPKSALLQGESMTCAATGVSGRLPDGTPFVGQYANTATVEAVDSQGTPLSDSDPSHYFETEPGIHVEKSTNGEDADRPLGPGIAVGNTVTWVYEVSNTGSEILDNITVEDDDPAVTPVYVSGDTNGNGRLNLGETWRYEATGIAVAGQYSNRAVASGDGSSTVVDEDPSHYFGASPSIRIEKSTNGQDADLPPGPAIPVTDPVNWLYEVTNTGNVPFTQWPVTDDQGVTVTCPRVILSPGATAVCSASAIATSGQYRNVATVSGRNPLLPSPVTDSDPSHYLGAVAVPALGLQKATNGEDADKATGPFIAPGDAVDWTYEVTNQGNVLLDQLRVRDFRLGPGAVSCPRVALSPGESVTCTATGTAAAGQYRNLALALARSTAGSAGSSPRILSNLVGAIDPSHYYGASPGIGIEKFTNGIDADQPADAVRIPIGDVVTWGYVVFNTGNEPLGNITVSDNRGVVPVYVEGDENNNNVLELGERWLFEASGTAQAGAYSNVGTVSAEDGFGVVVDASDPSHYFGFENDITVEKSTNGEDADFPPGPNVPVGSAVTWTYTVSNTGNTPLQNPVLEDDQGVIPVLDSGDVDNDGVLDPGEVWVYSAQGTAVAGQYENTATISAISEVSGIAEELQDQDPSHYFGGASTPGLTLEKYTNGRDADDAPGPLLRVGGEAIFVYIPRNTGDTPLSNVRVVDDQGVAVVCAGGNPIPQIDVGAAGYCVGRERVRAGQYRNVATASGTDLLGEAVNASDPSHHFGFNLDPDVNSQPSVQIEKATNGVDADAPTGPLLIPGDTASFSYVVTNTGNTPLSQLSVTDDQGVAVSCPGGNPIALLQPGASVTCTGSAIVTEGQYRNVGLVTANAPGFSRISDEDPSHHRGGSSTELQKVPVLPAPLLWLLVLLLGGIGVRAMAGRR